MSDTSDKLEETLHGEGDQCNEDQKYDANSNYNNRGCF